MDYPLDFANVTIMFTTHVSGTPTTLSSGSCVVYKDGITTGITSGITLTTDFNSVVGLNAVTIDLSADALYSAGSSYTLVVNTGIVGGNSVAGGILHRFTINNSATQESQDTTHSKLDELLVVTENTLPALVVQTLEAGQFFKEGQANGFTFDMVISSNHTSPATGMVVTAQRSIDNGPYTAVVGAISEKGAGSYYFSGTGSDFGGREIEFRFTADGADTVKYTVRTHGAV